VYFFQINYKILNIDVNDSSSLTQLLMTFRFLLGHSVFASKTNEKGE